MKTPEEIIREHYQKIGRAGGSVTGESKRRGDSDYYKRIAMIAVAKRKEKRQSPAASDPLPSV